MTVAVNTGAPINLSLIFTFLDLCKFRYRGAEHSSVEHAWLSQELMRCNTLFLQGPKWGTSWDSYREGLSGPAMKMTNEATLKLAVISVQLTLISAYEDNCPLNLLGQENILRSGHMSCSASEGKGDGYWIGAEQIKSHNAGKCMQWLSGDIERR